MNLRGNYGRLAEGLLEKGRKEDALKAIEYSLKNLPAKKLGYNFFMLNYPKFYYENGKSAEGRKLIDDIWAQAEDEINYWAEAYKVELRRAQSYSDKTYLSQLQQGLFAQQTRDVRGRALHYARAYQSSETI